MNTTFVIFAAFGFVILVGVIAFLVSVLLKKRYADISQNQAIGDLQKTMTTMQVQIMEHLANQLNAMQGRLDMSSGALNKEMRSFVEKSTEISGLLKNVEQSMQGVQTFQEIFKSPKLRGTWGEASLEHLLSQFYPKELYELQHMFVSGERADAVFKLPDGRMLVIDAKFPAENFTKLVEVPTEIEKDIARAAFVRDVKARIDEIATKYILPDEGTLDYAMMYVPAEAVYYEMINPSSPMRKEDITGYAWNKKIVVTSPNQLYLHLKTIEHWFHDVQMSRQTQEIIKRFTRIKKDGEKLADDFRLLGKHLGNAQGAYDSSEKRLGLLVGKVDQLTKGNIESKELESGEENE